MRKLTIAAFAFASSHTALAQEVVAPPVVAAPSASASMDDRTNWCDQYATWLVAMAPTAANAAPSDAQQAQHLQVELNSCKIDPQQYERETRAEADAAVEIAEG